MKNAYLLSVFFGMSVFAQNAWHPIGRDVIDQLSPEGELGLLEIYNDIPYVFTEHKLSAFLEGQWQQIGPQVSETITKDLVFDVNGIPIIATLTGNNNVSVMKLSGTWQTIGNLTFPDGAVSNITLAVSPSNEIYIGYSENTNAYDFLIKKFNGSDWVNVGNIAALDLSLVLKKLVFDSSGVLYFAGNAIYDMFRPTIKKLNGNNWENVGPAFAVSNDVLDFDVAPNGDMFLMLNASISAKLFKFDGQWTQLLQFPVNDYYPQMNAGNDSTLYIAYKTSEFIGVDKLVGLDRQTISAYQALYVGEYQYELDSNNNSVIIYNSTHGLNVISNTSGAFTQLGNEGICPDTFTTVIDFAIDHHHNSPYTVHVIDNIKIVIRKFDGTDWIQVGNFSEGVYPEKLFFDHFDRPYLLARKYVNGNLYRKVLRFSGSEWEEIISDQSDLIDIILGADDSVYLATYYNVKKFNGVDWNYLGESVSPYTIRKIYVGTDNIPRILVYTSINDGQNFSWQLKKLIDNSWQNEGESFITLFFDEDLNMKTLLDDSNIFYYLIRTSDLKIMRLNGNEYEMVGQPNLGGIAGLEYAKLSFDVDHSGTPYVSFFYPQNDPINGWQGNYLSAYKFDGSSWINIEDKAVDVSGYESFIRINNDNQPVIVYNKNGGFYGVYYGAEEEYPLGLKNTISSANINVYPNPVSEVLYLKIDQPIEKIDIYDMTGKLIMSQASNKKYIIVDVIASGMYFAKIKSDAGTTIVKFVKN